MYHNHIFSDVFDISLTTMVIFFLSNHVIKTLYSQNQRRSFISALTFFVAVAVSPTIGNVEVPLLFLSISIKDSIFI